MSASFTQDGQKKSEGGRQGGGQGGVGVICHRSLNKHIPGHILLQLCICYLN